MHAVFVHKPGEWYLYRHTGKLYYWPDVDLDNAEFRAPVLNELLRFEGADHVEKQGDVQYGEVEQVLNELLRYQRDAEKQERVRVQYSDMERK